MLILSSPAAFVCSACNLKLTLAWITVTPSWPVHQEQRVLNAAARVITGTRQFDRCLGQIDLLHDQLHWLDIPDRVLFKLAVTVHQCLNGRAPPYLSEHCIPVSSANTWRYLRSANGHLPFPAQHLRPSGVLSCWPDGLELTPGFYQGSIEQHGVLKYLKRICSRVTSASSALVVLDDYALYKSIRTHSLT